MIKVIATALTMLAAGPALAAWTTTSDAVRTAAKDPAIAGALAAMTRVDVAIVAGDGKAFLGVFAPDAAVNNPQNRVVTPQAVAMVFEKGLIDYHSLDRMIEHVALRPSGEVVAMGEETVRPRGQAPNAGKTVRRRFTDVWRNDGGTWKLALRQATIIEVK